MTPDSIKNTYYAFSAIVGICTVVGSYYATRASFTAALKHLIERVDRVEKSVDSITDSITILTRDVGYLEGRVNGKTH